MAKKKKTTYIRSRVNVTKAVVLSVGIVIAIVGAVGLADTLRSGAGAATSLRSGYGMSDPAAAVAEPAVRDAYLDGVKSMGMRWVRTDLAWKYLQPTKGGAYNWAIYDGFVRAAAQRGIQVIGILDYAPDWAAAPDCNVTQGLCPPASLSQFNSYVNATVRHYKALGVRTWEVWNEPNIALFWGPKPNAATYTSLLKNSYNTIKSIDSGAVVISSGLAPADTTDTTAAPEDFLRAVYANGGKRYFDAVGAHPYSYPAAPGDTDPWSGWQRMVNMHNIMQANGDGAKKVWATEVGAPTNGPGVMASQYDRKYAQYPDHVDEAFQAYILSQAVAVFRSYSWAGPMLFYDYRDLSTATTTNENFFGILRFDGSQKPGYSSLKEAIRLHP